MKKNIIYISLYMCLFLFGACSSSDNEPENSKVYLETNTNRILLKEEGGTSYINIASNTKWTILIENEEIPVNDLEVSPLSGEGDETIKITYGREINKVQCEHATLIFYYYSEGKRIRKDIVLSRQEDDNVDDDEIWIPVMSIVKATDTFPPTFITADGYKLISITHSYIINVIPGDMYFINGQYNESMMDINKNEIHIELLSEPVCVSGHHVVQDNTNMYSSNAPFYSSNYNNIGPTFFDKYILIVPVYFWVTNIADNIQEELNKHTFMLAYDSDANSNGNLHMRLLHNVSELEDLNRTFLTAQYCSFNISSAVYNYKSAMGTEPRKIIIEYMVNSSNDRLDQARVEKYALDYNFK